MLKRCIIAENRKLHASPIWVIFFVLPLISAGYGTFNYLQNLEILTERWYSLWTQHTLFTCYFFLPIMLGIYCSYLMRLENSNHNWNKLLTMPIKPWQVFVSKLVTASLMLVLSELWIGLLFIVSGKIAGISEPIPKDLILWLACGTLGGMVMASVQLMLSAILKSFALPVGIALAGGISGLVALAKGFGHIYPYALMAYGMRSNAPQVLMENGNLQFVVICLVFLALFTASGSLWLSKRDI